MCAHWRETGGRQAEGKWEATTHGGWPCHSPFSLVSFRILCTYVHTPSVFLKLLSLRLPTVQVAVWDPVACTTHRPQNHGFLTNSYSYVSILIASCRIFSLPGKHFVHFSSPPPPAPVHLLISLWNSWQPLIFLLSIFCCLFQTLT